MRSKKTERSITFRGRIFSCIVLMLLASCSGGPETSENNFPDTGDIVFHLSIESDGPEIGGYQASAVDCAATGIATIEVDVYDINDNLLASGGPWSCTAHQGTITGVLAGINRKIICLAKDAGSTVLYTGEKSGISVVAGVPNDAGEIVLSIPVPGVTITESDGSTSVSEDGVTDTYNVVLDSQPLSDVTITVSPDSQSNVNFTVLTFTAANWNTPQTVTVSAVDDAAVEGTHTSTISHNASSSDSNYSGIVIANVVANITDNDPVAPVTLIWDSGNWDDALWD